MNTVLQQFGIVGELAAIPEQGLIMLPEKGCESLLVAFTESFPKHYVGVGSVQWSLFWSGNDFNVVKIGRLVCKDANNSNSAKKKPKKIQKSLLQNYLYLHSFSRMSFYYARTLQPT